MIMQRTLLTLLLATAACTGDIGAGGDDGSGSGSGSGSSDPDLCPTARSYTGFGTTPLEADRPVLAAGADRMRLKPYAALAAEYARALGLSSVDTTAFAATFGKPPARWYAEPAASANTLYAAFALAYGACSQFTSTGGAFDTAPTAAQASALCGDFAHRAWNRDMSDAELASCVDYATTKTGSDAPARRWAYTCAAVLSASGFLSY
jgi:hypothetical protein